MEEIEQITDVQGMVSYRSSLAPKTKVGYVPTMGYLHAGHESLIRRSVETTDVTIVSIFVNPKQFAANEDLQTYPRDVERDLRVCRLQGVDAVFTPSSMETIYPSGFSTTVTCQVGEACTNKHAEGGMRPTFFQGVTTVLTKLFLVVKPTCIFFGQKDAQQCAVVKRLCTDLFIDIDLIIGKIIREKNGLAMSSRNSYLTNVQRDQAKVIHIALNKASHTFSTHYHHGRLPVHANEIRRIVNNCIERNEKGNVIVEYVSVCDRWTMKEINDYIGEGRSCLVCVAAKVGDIRLVDNIVLCE